VSEPVPTLCAYHASVYATRSAHLSKVHGDSGDDLRDEAATVARQCPQCWSATTEGGRHGEDR
jgi:hypothetical protein